MTYNLRQLNAIDAENSWDNRKESLAREILFYEPDFLSTQEGFHLQLEYLANALSGYQYIGVGRRDGHTADEHCAIFYNTQKVDLIHSDTFWLSPTPERPSKGWDATFERICTYGCFRYKDNGEEVSVFNTHFDHIGTEARIQSADLIIHKINEITSSNTPVLLTGDFNLTPETAPIQRLSEALNDALLVSETPAFGPSATYNGFSPSTEPLHRIDYIFCNNAVRILKFATLSHLINGRFNSDHFPLIASFE